MRGSIRKRGKNSWAIIVDLPPDPDTGERRRKWITVRGTKRYAEAERARIVNEINQGRFVDASTLTLGDYLDQWYRDHAIPNLRPRTTEGYATIIRNHLKPKLGNIKLKDLTPQCIQQYYSRQLKSGRADGKAGGLSPQSIKHHREVLSKTLADAVKWGLVYRNAASAATPPRVPRSEMVVLDPEGISDVLETARNTPYFAAIHLFVHTGLRRSELLGLRWQDVDLPQQRIAVRQVLIRLKGLGVVFEEPKTDKSRTPIVLTSESVLVLRAHRERQEAESDVPVTSESLVFCWPNGTPWKPDTLTHSFKRLARKAGHPGATLQSLRHSHGSIMIKAGVHLKMVQDRLRHSRMTTTYDRYVHLLPGAEESAAEAFERELKNIS